MTISEAISQGPLLRINSEVFCWIGVSIVVRDLQLFMSDNWRLISWKWLALFSTTVLNPLPSGKGLCLDSRGALQRLAGWLTICSQNSRCFLYLSWYFVSLLVLSAILFSIHVKTRIMVPVKTTKCDTKIAALVMVCGRGRSREIQIEKQVQFQIHGGVWTPCQSWTFNKIVFIGNLRVIGLSVLSIPSEVMELYQ